MTKIAFILAGCGSKDGSEIHEATCALLAADQYDCDYHCFALNREQYCVVNHLTGEMAHEKRNILVESARICRGEISELKELSVKDYDIVFFIGGFGAAQNNFSYYYEGEDYRVDTQIRQIVEEFATAGKPICAVCIAPLILAKTLKGVDLTLGNNKSMAKIVEDNGNHFVDTDSGHICIDKQHKVITAPCYMLARRIKTIYEEDNQIIAAALALLA